MPPGTTYTAVRTVELASRQVREVRRLVDQHAGDPVAWDRERSLIGATEHAQQGLLASVAISESGGAKRFPISGLTLFATASADARRVAALDESEQAIRVWDLDGFEQARTLTASPGERILGITRGTAAPLALRPESQEIAVAVLSRDGSELRVELWTADGARRVVTSTRSAPQVSGSLSGLWFRPDGSALIVGGWQATPSRILLLDLVKGGATPIPAGMNAPSSRSARSPRCGNDGRVAYAFRRDGE